MGIDKAYFQERLAGRGGSPHFGCVQKAIRAFQKHARRGKRFLDVGRTYQGLVRWFLGEFTQVTGFLQTSFWDIAPPEDNAFCLLRTEKGQVASIHVSWTQWKNLFSFEVFGQDGYIKVNGLGGGYGVERATSKESLF